MIELYQSDHPWTQYSIEWKWKSGDTYRWYVWEQVETRQFSPICFQHFEEARDFLDRHLDNNEVDARIVEVEYVRHPAKEA